jgi:hypothetical protein
MGMKFLRQRNKVKSLNITDENMCRSVRVFTVVQAVLGKINKSCD